MLTDDIKACRLCAARFAATATRHAPRPVVWFDADTSRRSATHGTAPLMIVGQAPGMQVHLSGRPFADRSGERLRDWLGLAPETFYDRSRISIVPMAFCFPGYDAKGSDLPPPKICAETWRAQVMEACRPRMLVVIGGYAQGWHLGTRNVTATVSDWRSHAPAVWPLPHPSWRNTGWLRRNPWFEAELLPELRAATTRILREET